MRPEVPVAVQPNPFLNLLGNQQPAPGSSAQQTGSAQGIIPPPPFFFPTLPFMAPYTIPPPPMPANLDQLSVEELRAMEGNERNHVEERLKLLRNVQTMLNASAALMSQYQMVMANLTPLPIPPPAAVVTSAPEPSSSSEEIVTTTENNQVRLEDIGSEDNVVDSTTPPTNKFSILDDTTSAFIAEESLASTSSSGESEEANEIRKRRLQKFAQSD